MEKTDVSGGVGEMGVGGVGVGVLLPITRSLWGEGADARRLVDLGRRAEELGFDSLWVNDSLVSPRIEALAMLSALAPVTSRVVLGTAALLPVLRRPVQAANALASIDLLSGGRLVVGVGAGFPGRLGQPMHEVSEVPWERRFARLDDTVALWRQLWTRGGARSFRGEVLAFKDLPEPTIPFRDGGPKIWLGGASPAALVRAGRLYDGWLPYPPDPRDYGSGLEVVRRAAGEVGRGVGDVSAALFVTVRVGDGGDGGGEGQVVERFVGTAYGLSLSELRRIQAVVWGDREEVVARLLEYVREGARHLVVRIAALGLDDQAEQMERLADVGRELRQRAAQVGRTGVGAGGAPVS